MSGKSSRIKHEKTYVERRGFTQSLTHRSRRLRSGTCTNRPQINLFQPLRLRSQIEILSNDLGAIERDPRKEPGILRRIEKRSSQFFMITLRHEHARNAV